MRDNIFYQNKIDSSYIYNKDFLFYVLCKILYENKNLDFKNICDRLTEKYLETIKLSHLKNLLDENFSCFRGKYFLDFQTEMFMKSTIKFLTFIEEISKKSEDLLVGILSKYISESCVSTIDGIKYFCAYLYKKEILNINQCGSLYLNSLLSIDKKIKIIDDHVVKVCNEYKNFPIDKVINNNDIVYIFYINNINTVEDMLKLSSNSLGVFFIIDFDNIIVCINQISLHFSQLYNSSIEKTFNKLSKIQLDVLNLRNGFSSGEKKVLEEIGQLFNITRERIRQIELKATNIIINEQITFKNTLIFLYLLLGKNEEDFIGVDQLLNFFKDETLARKIIFLYSLNLTQYRYNDNYHFIYDASINTIEDIERKLYDFLENFVSIETYNSLPYSLKKFVCFNYRLSKNIYIRKGLRESDLIVEILEKHFPNGYKISSTSDFEKFMNVYTNDYGGTNMYTQRNIYGAFSRIEVCLVDKGTYKVKSLCVRLSDELLNKIINYIVTENKTIFYRTIYSQFEKELNSLSVDNSFYLKGILDPYLPDEIITKRNYLMVKGNHISSREAMRSFIKSFSNIFSLKEINNEFPGVKNYTIYDLLYEETSNGLLFLSDKKFIYSSKINTDFETFNKIKLIIEENFEVLNSDVISVNKIYSKISLFHKELLTNLKYIGSSFDLFSLLSFKFNGKYGFNRPLICKDIKSQTNILSTIIDYASKLNHFSSKTIKKYCERMNIRGLYSYLEFMENLSDEFVQTNVDEMISKTELNVSLTQLEKIRGILKLILKVNQSFDVSKFNGFSLLPTINVSWNKYLLVGIVRSYLQNEFEVINTKNTFDKTNYIVRRII